MIIIDWNSYYIVAIIPSILIAIGTFFITKTENKDKRIGFIILLLGIWIMLGFIISMFRMILRFT